MLTTLSLEQSHLGMFLNYRETPWPWLGRQTGRLVCFPSRSPSVLRRAKASVGRAPPGGGRGLGFAALGDGSLGELVEGLSNASGRSKTTRERERVEQRVSHVSVVQYMSISADPPKKIYGSGQPTSCL